MSRWTWSLTALMLACGDVQPPPPPDPHPVDPCAELAPLSVQVVPNEVRVQGAATVMADGGTGHYTFALAAAPSGATLSGDRYVAGPTPATDQLQAHDECGGSSTASVTVRAAFSVSPSRARLNFGATFSIATAGFVGSATFTAQALGSGGSVSGQGVYTAGTHAGVDLIVVRDSATGDQALLQYTVDGTARFHAQPAKVALPAGSSIPLQVVDGTGVVDWAVTMGGGTVETVGSDLVLRAPADGGVTALEGTDHFTGEKTTLVARSLTELTRPDLRAQGRRSDTAALVSADFDGDGIADVALGVPENDLKRPQGGAVFIYRGSANGLPTEATWVITGASDTAQLGAVLATGDLDGDGKADLAISAPGDDVTVADSGAVYLYTFGADGPHLLRALTGLGRGNFGASIAIGDVDGDGDNDLVVGSPGADLAPGTGYTSRGVVDVFLLQPGQPIADLGSLRFSGADLAADGTLRKFSNTRAGRGLLATDLNGDGKLDLAFLSTVNNTLLGGMPVAKAVTAVQIHLGREGSKRFGDEPDVYVLPSNPADGDEGQWSLRLLPAAGGKPALLVTVADGLDSPNLSAQDGGVGGVNTGGALLFDLSAAVAHTDGGVPQQVGRTDALARVWGDQPFTNAGRGSAIADIDGDGESELVLGAPYATPLGAPSVAGKLLVYHPRAIAPHGQVNRPDSFRAGSGRTDTLGIAVASWNGRVVAYNGRATTTLGDFTGRLDLFSSGSVPSSWTTTSAAIPSKPASQSLGANLDVGVLTGQLTALVASPTISGPGLDLTGNEVGAGQALIWKVSSPSQPRVLVEGANTPYTRDGGWPAFGGRPVGSDVALTDFDGDGRLDAVVAAPAFTVPALQADGGLASNDYAALHPECLRTAAQGTGAMLVSFGLPDGTWRDGARVWATSTITGCTIPDGGSASACTRSSLGRQGVVGRFDFDGDGKQDLAVTRANGLEVLAGRARDDATLGKLTMSCGVLFSLPALPWATSVPSALGDLDGDGCDEVAVRYSDGGNRQGVVIAFGFDASQGRCGGHSKAAWVRISGDTETGVATMRLGVSTGRAGKVMADGKDYVAITADLYPWQGQTQPAILLIDSAQLVAKRPTQDEQLVSILGDGLTPIPIVNTELTPGFGKVVVGNVDLTGDGRPDLVVSAPGANVNGDGTGAVFVFAGGTVVRGPNLASILIVGDARERSAFGQDLSVTPSTGSTPAAIGIGAPLSYRTGTANGTAFVLPFDF